MTRGNLIRYCVNKFVFEVSHFVVDNRLIRNKQYLDLFLPCFRPFFALRYLLARLICHNSVPTIYGTVIVTDMDDASAAAAVCMNARSSDGRMNTRISLGTLC